MTFLLVREVALVGVAAQGWVSGLRPVIKSGCICTEVHLAALGTIPTCRWGPQNLMTHYKASCLICLYETRFHTCEPQDIEVMRKHR